MSLIREDAPPLSAGAAANIGSALDRLGLRPEEAERRLAWSPGRLGLMLDGREQPARVEALEIGLLFGEPPEYLLGSGEGVFLGAVCSACPSPAVPPKYLCDYPLPDASGGKCALPLCAGCARPARPAMPLAWQGMPDAEKRSWEKMLETVHFCPEHSRRPEE